MFAENCVEEAVRSERNSRTELTEFFDFNASNPSNRVIYSNFPTYLVWDKTNRRRRPPKFTSDTIGRVFTVHPCAGERFYLRMILHHEQYAGKVFLMKFCEYSCLMLYVFFLSRQNVFSKLETIWQ